MSAATQTQGQDKSSEDVSVRRFREVHYHRFKLGTRSNVHGTCVLRSHLPVRLPRPHTMQQIYNDPPPGVGYRRLILPQWHEARDRASLLRLLADHERSVIGEINQERATTAKWLESKKAIARTHVVVATQSNLLFFVAGFGYWNVLDINLNLINESCAGVKAFEMPLHRNGDKAKGSPKGHEKDTDDLLNIDQDQLLPALVVALTTYVKQPSEKREGVIDESGSYRLYALGADSLPPIPQEFVDMHALVTSSAKSKEEGNAVSRKDPPSAKAYEYKIDVSEARSNSQPVDMASRTGPSLGISGATLKRSASVPQTASSVDASSAAGHDMFSADEIPFVQHKDPIDAIPLNSYAYLEERLLSLRVSEKTLRVDLNYLPFRISHDIIEGMPPILLVAGNDNKIHRYAFGCDRIIEIEPLLCPKTDVPLTYTAYDARTIGPFHVQITAHQEFSVALQASRALTEKELAQEQAKKEGSSISSRNQRLMRRLLVADEEVYDAAPILTTIFTPHTNIIDRSAFDFMVTRLTSSSAMAEDGSNGESSSSSQQQLEAGDVYNCEWPLGTTESFPSLHSHGKPETNSSQAVDKPPRVHALIGFVGEDAVIYHDVPVAGLDPVPTLVGGVAGKVPESAPHISGRLGGLGGVFSLAGSSREGMITSVHFDDLDFDGSKEVIVGTVSGAVMIYKSMSEKGYVLVWKRRFPAPVYGIFSVDINCDGANELVVATLTGVHIMQPNLAHIRAKLLRQLLLARNEQSASSTSSMPTSGGENDANCSSAARD
ncbi:hypothetical protein IW140_000519 [Coemansia sp. RSA 1813]|nr:hypothetical protein EV178_004030 [Coemansia sp. RSA 1646]KAJ1773985.1 hypothetical protein LPJ74_000084 [Coemansia sp. RSA 1843]KAJ2092623.1 hypothetical protein IW138_001061 [Coemansia sp. RSA 986]KAJ2213381.1 hypothetical protein EV179_003890 [Coemansia sp. RSA 487]KAJ2572756.1 hypothetical protein IW140_000519 [Coemansia sp. RSA 1813]